jgi:hypothetical protein
MSEKDAVASSAVAVPARRSGASPSAAPAATAAGAAATSRMSRGDVFWRSYQPGKRRAASCAGRGSKIRPPGAASWWAVTTRVSAAAGFPASATTLTVVRLGSSRRKTCRPPDAASAIPAAVSVPTAAASARPPRPRAARPAVAAAADIRPSGTQ